ncbi:hypothetical protein D9619_000925 [Psilocybe cf. subviscida]|uniref:MARVEL domain-containing protein n=1 Tax=Psilocybe cf. subviscida TaxID=2480587 RepID=A0A8H5BCV3_9AGAR|nr:hypothetical protein D9619_000925 [Psilocybe cf. subviscida]
MSSNAVQSHSRRPSEPVPVRRTCMSSSLFNTIRASIYGAVILFTVICLAMAGRFQTVLASSDLTRFVPFAIFVCSASLLIFLVLQVFIYILSFGFFLRGRNPISTRIELACLGLAGVFWLALGVFLVTSDAQSADVECFSPDNGQLLDDELASFHTDQYQAMYRVLNAFSLMNAVLVIFALFALLFLAVRRHRNGDEHMWYGPVTSCAWFNNYYENTKQTRAKTSSSSILPVTQQTPVYSRQKDTEKKGNDVVYTEKPERKASARREHRQYPSSNYPYSSSPTYPSTQPYLSRSAYPAAPKATSPGRYARQGSGSSPRSGSAAADLENGGMLNPYTSRRARS